MQIKKSEIEVFYVALKNTEGVLSLPEARIRDKFMKGLGEHLDTYAEDKTKIYVAYCHKKEDGSPDIKDDKYSFPLDKVDTINEEVRILDNELIELDPPTELKAILEKTDYKPKVGEVEVLDSITEKL